MVYERQAVGLSPSVVAREKTENVTETDINIEL